MEKLTEGTAPERLGKVLTSFVDALFYQISLLLGIGAANGTPVRERIISGPCTHAVMALPLARYARDLQDAGCRVTLAGAACSALQHLWQLALRLQARFHSGFALLAPSCWACYFPLLSTSASGRQLIW